MDDEPPALTPASALAVEAWVLMDGYVPERLGLVLARCEVADPDRLIENLLVMRAQFARQEPARG